MVWAGYHFAAGSLDETLNLSKSQMPTFQHFPAPLRGLAREAVLADWNIPAPSFFAGLLEVWTLDKSTPDAYMFGKLKAGGWWYFFLVEVLFKTPLPFLILLAVGSRQCFHWFKTQNWKLLVPAVAVLSVLIFTTGVSVNSGLRHVLVIFPFLAIVAGSAASELWKAGNRFHLGKVLLVVLMFWQSVIALWPGTDWISYFNGLAGRDPSKIVISGCDLDCGQDVLNLAHELESRGVNHISLALWTTADLQKMGLPQFDVLEPFRPVSGWVAVSVRSMREGSVQHKSYPAGAFSWLSRYTPVTQVGNTIWLYNISSVDQLAEHASPKSARY